MERELNLEVGRKRRNEGTSLLFSEIEFQKIMDAIELLARREDSLTADDVWEQLAKWGTLSLSRPNAVGAAILNASKRNMIENTGCTRQSVATNRRAGRNAIWRSLLYKKEGT